jgi:hypothetical protein
MVTEGDRTYLFPTDPAAARTALSEALAGAERQLTGVHRYDDVGIAIREEQGRLSHLLLTIERGEPLTPAREVERWPLFTAEQIQRIEARLATERAALPRAVESPGRDPEPLMAPRAVEASLR